MARSQGVFAQERQTTVLTDVPITGPQLPGWSPTCKRHRATVALPIGPPEVRPFDREIFAEACASDAPLRPIIPWGSADRYALGWLIAYKAYIERSYEPAVPPRPLALVAPGHDSNVRAAYEALDIEIVPVIGGRSGRRASGGSGGAARDPWEHPGSGEDLALHSLWRRRGQKDWWLAEVPVGIGERAPRRLDAAVIPWPGKRHSGPAQDLDEFQDAVASGVPVELIESKAAPRRKLSASSSPAATCFPKPIPVTAR